MKFSKEFIFYKPKEIFELWTKFLKLLTITNLISTIISFVKKNKSNNKKIEMVLNFLLQYVKTTKNKDMVAHNYLIILLAQYPGERPLIEYLTKSSKRKK